MTAATSYPWPISTRAGFPWHSIRKLSTARTASCSLSTTCRSRTTITSSPGRASSSGPGSTRKTSRRTSSWYATTHLLAARTYSADFSVLLRFTTKRNSIREAFSHSIWTRFSRMISWKSKNRILMSSIQEI